MCAAKSGFTEMELMGHLPLGHENSSLMYDRIRGVRSILYHSK